MISKRGIFFFILLISGLPLLAQRTGTELENELKLAQTDTARFRILMSLSKEAEYYDYTRCRKYMDDAIVVARRINSFKVLWDANQRLAFLENMEGDYSDALRFHQQCVKLCLDNKDSTRLSRSLMNVGRDYSDLGEYEDGYFYLTQSYNVAKTHNKIPSREDSLVMAIALHNIGDIFMEVGQFDVAQSHINASEKISISIKDIEAKAYNYNILGELYRRKGEFDQSEKFLLTSLNEAKRLKIGVLIPDIESHLGRLYLDKKEYHKSLTYYDSAIAFQSDINNRFRQAECYLGKGMVMSMSNNYAEAARFYTKCLEGAKALHARNLQASCYRELAGLSEIRKDYQTALQYHKQHDELRDSLFSEAIMEKLFQSQVRFETANKDLMIEALNEAQQEQSSELHKQELVLNVLVILIALTVLMLFTVYRSGQRRKRINVLLLEHQEEIKRRSAELEQLNEVKDKFFSIISHDLRSPMNALAGTLDLLDNNHLTKEEFHHLTGNLKTQFSHTRSLINNLLNWTLLQMDKLKVQPEKVALHSIVNESFNALKMLYPKNIEMRNDVPVSQLAMADPNIVNLVMRNLILNAIKFTEAGGLIKVSAVQSGKEVTVTVSDNGIGIRPEVREHLFVKPSAYTTRGTANERGTGIGLMLCKEFIEKNGGKIWFESEVGKGTSFHFTLPAI